MPRCFMAKKLKSGLYEQWKQEQEQKDTSRSSSPCGQDDPLEMSHLERSNQLSAASAAGSESGQHEQITHSKS